MTARGHRHPGGRAMDDEGALQSWIDTLADRFEGAWRDGARPAIESFLAHASGPGRERLLKELLQVEISLRRAAGEEPTPADYLGRFPAHEEAVADACRAIPDRPTASAWPTVVGFEIEGRLGRGGMGVVYRARQRDLGRVVALKMIREDAAREEDLARFLGDAEALARFQHPHIVQVYAVGRQHDRPYIVLEYVDGGSLHDRWGGLPQPPAPAAQLVETLARAIDHAHRCAVVHRDLKPANILLTADGTPKVTDFGLARRLDAAARWTEDGQLLGTARYMAPEQAAGRAGEAGPAADVYALGAILYEAFTGRPPFGGASLAEILEQIRSTEPVPPSRLVPKLPRDLETICLKCLEKSPEKRYPTAADLADDLRRFRDFEPIRARPPGAWGRGVKFARRHRFVVGGTAAVLISLVAGVVGTSIALARAHRAEGQATDALYRALGAESDLRNQLVASHLQAARLAVQRGDAGTALRAYDAALAAGCPDPLAIRLRKVQALRMQDERQAAERELEALAPSIESSAQAGPFHLIRGDLAMLHSTNQEQALEDIRRALAAGGLPPADASYAHALLAPYVPEALTHCEEALSADPFHQQAQELRLLVLLFLGRWDEFRAGHLAYAALYPEDTSIHGDLALLHALEGDARSARAELDRVHTRATRERTEALADLLGLVAEVANTLRAADAMGPEGGQGPSVATLARKLIPLYLNVMIKPGDLGVSGLRFVNLPCLSNTFGPLIASETLAALHLNGPAKRRIEPVLEHHPDAFFHCWYGGLIDSDYAERKPEGRELLLRASERVYRRAAGLPSIIPRMARHARFHAAVNQALLGAPGPGERRPDLAMRAEAVRNMRHLLRLGGLSLRECKMMSRLALRIGEVDLARTCAAEWADRADDDLELLQICMEIEYRAGSWGRSLELADRLLEREPAAVAARRIRTEAPARLREQFRALVGRD